MKEELDGFILKLTTEFEKIIPEEKEKNDIIGAFKNYLYFAVNVIQEATLEFKDKDVDSIKLVLTRIANVFGTSDLAYVKRNLLVDNAFETIKERSAQIFDMAKNSIRVKETNIDIDVDIEIKKMTESLKSVKEYNERQARSLISEAILDLEYITTLSEEALSLRLYHYLETLKDMEVER